MNTAVVVELNTLPKHLFLINLKKGKLVGRELFVINKAKCLLDAVETPLSANKKA